MSIENFIKSADDSRDYPQHVNNFGIIYCYLGICYGIDEFTISCMGGFEEDIIAQTKEVIKSITQFSIEAGLDAEDILGYDGATIETPDYSVERDIQNFYIGKSSLDELNLTSQLKGWVTYVKASIEIATETNFETIFNT